MPLRSVREELDRRIASLDSRAAHYLSCFASVLARVAHADRYVADSERAEMQRRVAALAELSDAEAALVVDLAVARSRTHTGEESARVTEQFRAISSPRQRAELFFCLFAVAGADGVISESELAEINAIADELGVERTPATGIRADRRLRPVDC